MTIKDEHKHNAAAPFRRRHAYRRGIGDPPRSLDALAELQAELTLLREDNARLKTAQHRPADLGTLVERVRALSGDAPGQTGEDTGDEAAQMLAEGLVLCDSLLGVCAELSQSIASVEARLRALAPVGA
jgi:hypothetical protein